jgi:hypothetical protein
MALVVAANRGMAIHSMDVDTAYLNATLDEEVYMKPPSIVRHQFPGKIFKLRKSLYGLKQAGRQWYLLLSSKLAEDGWTASKHDQCLFTRGCGESLEYLLVYVDDILVIARTDEAAGRIKAEIMSHFDSKDFGPVTEMLGIKIDYDRSKRSVTLSQKQYVESILSRFQIQPKEKASVPADRNKRVYAHDGVASTEEVTLYLEMVGSLLYLAHVTRPDICYAVSYASRFCANPGPDHFSIVRKVLKYLQSTKDYALVLNGTGDLQLRAFTDADWGGDLTDRKSTSGRAIFLGRSLVGWGSSKQPSVSLSSMESEYISMSDGIREVLWLQEVAKDLGLKLKPAEMLCDNQSAIHSLVGARSSSKARHIDIRYHFARDLIEKRLISASYVSTSDNLADLFTKALCCDQHHNASQRLGIMRYPAGHAGSVPNREGGNMPPLGINNGDWPGWGPDALIIT